MQDHSPQEHAFRRSLLNRSVVFVGLLTFVHSLHEIYLDAPFIGMSYFGLVASVFYCGIPLIRHRWFTSERISLILIIFGIPYLSIRIWTLNGVGGSTVAWYLIFVLYAVFFNTQFVRRTVVVAILVTYFIVMYFCTYYPPHNYAHYPPELAAALSFYILTAILYYMYLTSKAYDHYKSSFTKVSLRAVHSQKLIETGRLAGQIAHEVSSPLNALSFINETMFQKLTPDLQAKLHVEFEQHNMVLSRIAKNVQAILRSVSKSTEKNIEVINAENIMTDLNVLLSCRLKESNVQLICDMSGIRWGSNFRADVAGIMQALVILTNNSLDALMTEGFEKQYKFIKLIFLETDGTFEITVFDNGPGMSAQAEKKLFTEGFTTKNSGQLKGNGLGLCIAREVLWQMDGEISYKPHKEGCAFHIVLKKTKN